MKLPKLTLPKLDVVHNFFLPIFWGTSDNATVTKLVSAALPSVQSGYHFADNLFTWGRNLSMFDDAEFVKAWRDNIELPSDEAIVWRRYVLACAGYHCVQLGGDFVECGAYKGVGVKTVLDYLGGKEFPRNFWAYDLFEHEEGMKHHVMPEHGPQLFDQVKGKFADYPNVRVIKGEIPKVFENNSPEKIAYLHIDMN